MLWVLLVLADVVAAQVVLLAEAYVIAVGQLAEINVAIVDLLGWRH